MSSDEAVRQGITATAGTVTSAAMVMVRGLLDLRHAQTIIDMKEMGIGLAVAVLIDATIVRAVLLPAAMKLLGERNWYLPRSLGWLPKARALRAGGRAGPGVGRRERGEAAPAAKRASRHLPRRPLRCRIPGG